MVLRNPARHSSVPYHYPAEPILSNAVHCCLLWLTLHLSRDHTQSVSVLFTNNCSILAILNDVYQSSMCGR